MRYRNINTGAEFESQCEITAPDWIVVGADTPLIISEPKEEPKAPPEAPLQVEEKKTVTKKPAPKGKAKKGARK